MPGPSWVVGCIRKQKQTSKNYKGKEMPILKHVNFAAAVLLASSSLMWTQKAQAGSDTQTAEEAGVYRMPAGDFRTSAVSGGDQAIPRRSATPDAELMRIKGLRAAAAAEQTAVPPAVQPAVEPRALFTECVTNAGTGFFPSDIHGAATPDNLVVVTNVDISVRNKTSCALISAVSLKTFFNNFSIPSTETLFDPRVVYDRLHNRCLVSAESRNSASGNTDQFLYIAASLTSSCTT
jgi:hypothetical protein